MINKVCGKKVIDRSHSFSDENKARKWGQEFVEAINNGDNLDLYLSSPRSVSYLLLKTIIKMKETDSLSPQVESGYKNLAALKLLRDTPVNKLTSEAIISLAKELRGLSQGQVERQPSTVKWYIDILSSALDDAKGICGIRASNTCISDARKPLKKLKLISDSKPRQRLVNGQEYKRIIEHTTKLRDSGKFKISYLDIFRFGVSQGLRLEEHATLDWQDVNLDLENEGASATITIRSHKDPTTVGGRDSVSPLTDEAFNVLMELGPKKSGPIFPYNFKSASTGFTKIFAELEIHELSFRDFRRTAVTQLFLQGLALEKVALISRHKCMEVLRRHYLVVQAMDVANELKAIQPHGKNMQLLQNKSSRGGVVAKTLNRLFSRVAASVKTLCRKQI